MELDAEQQARCAPWVALLHAALEGGPTPAVPEALRRSVAWQLKHLAQAAWSLEPPRVPRHAMAMHLLLQSGSPSDELLALRDWIDAMAALAQGQCDTALNLLRQAGERFAGAGLALYAAQTRVPCTVALGLLGRPAEALAEAKEALAQFLSLGDERAAGKLELNIGTLLLRDERAEPACEHYRRAAVRFARVGDVELSVLADIGLANALTQRCELVEAAFVNERARRRAQAQGLTLLAAQAEAAIGRIALQRGDPATALPPLARARALLAQGGAAPQRLLEADEALADAHASAGLGTEAEAMYSRLAQDADALGASREAQRARLRQARLLTRLARGSEALEVLAQLEPMELPIALQAQRLFARAEASGLAADAALAAQALQQAELPSLALEARLLQAQRQSTDLAKWQELLDASGGMPGLHARTRMLRAQVLLGAGQREAAASDLDAALDWAAAQREALLLDEFRSASDREHDQAARLRLRLAREAGEGDEALFVRIERLRSQALPPLRALPAPSRDAETMRSALLAAQQRSQAAQQAGDLPRWQQLQQVQRQLEAGWLERWRRDALSESATGAQHAIHDAALPRPDGQQLDAALAPDEAWVHWQLDASGNAGDPAPQLLALVRWQKRWQRLLLPAAPVLRALADVQFQFEALRAGRMHWLPHAPELTRRARLRLQTLHQLLWAPLQPLLQGCRQVVVAPHAELLAVPWAALHDGTDYLCQRLHLRIAASAARWCAAQQLPPTACTGEVLALGACGEQRAQLPAVRAELAAIEEQVAAQGLPLRLLKDAAANRAALQQHIGQARLLHLAGHAAVRDDNPAFSSLLLGDGPLLAHDLAQLRLREGAVVVLSACDGARSLRSAGHEQLGLLRALWLAGARAVLASPWALDDEATAAWMHRFYAAWSAGSGLAASVQAAQQQAAQAGEHPALWGGFAVHGPG